MGLGKYISKLFGYVHSLRLIPHLIVFYTCPDREGLEYERDRWLTSWRLNKRGWRGLLLLLNSLPEYRSLFYFRTGKHWLSHIARGQNNLEFYCASSQIGWGLVIWHGFSTVINPISIGQDCDIWQNVTIGKKSSDPVQDRPTIGDRVKICSSAIVTGLITIGNDSTIGAGAVAVKDVPPYTTVVSQPSRYINLN